MSLVRLRNPKMSARNKGQLEIQPSDCTGSCPSGISPSKCSPAPWRKWQELPWLARKHLLCTRGSIAPLSLLPHSCCTSSRLVVVSVPPRLSDTDSPLQARCMTWRENSGARVGPWLPEAQSAVNNSKTRESGTTGAQGSEPCCDWGFAGRKGLGVLVEMDVGWAGSLRF